MRIFLICFFLEEQNMTSFMTFNGGFICFYKWWFFNATMQCEVFTDALCISAVI